MIIYVYQLAKSYRNETSYYEYDNDNKDKYETFHHSEIRKETLIQGLGGVTPSNL